MVSRLNFQPLRISEELRACVHLVTSVEQLLRKTPDNYDTLKNHEHDCASHDTHARCDRIGVFCAKTSIKNVGEKTLRTI